MINDQQFADLLLNRELITQGKLREALELQQRHGGELYHIVLENGLVDEERTVISVANQMNIPCVSLKDYKGTADVLDLLAAEMATRHKVVPLGLSQDQRSVYLAMANPIDMIALDEVSVATGCDIVAFLAGPLDIDRTLERCYSQPDDRSLISSIFTTSLLDDYPSKARNSKAPMGDMDLFGPALGSDDEELLELEELEMVEDASLELVELDDPVLEPARDAFTSPPKRPPPVPPPPSRPNTRDVPDAPQPILEALHHANAPGQEIPEPRTYDTLEELLRAVDPRLFAVPGVDVKDDGQPAAGAQLPAPHTPASPGALPPPAHRQAAPPPPPSRGRGRPGPPPEPPRSRPRSGGTPHLGPRPIEPLSGMTPSLRRDSGGSGPLSGMTPSLQRGSGLDTRSGGVPSLHRSAGIDTRSGGVPRLDSRSGGVPGLSRPDRPDPFAAVTSSDGGLFGSSSERPQPFGERANDAAILWPSDDAPKSAPSQPARTSDLPGLSGFLTDPNDDSIFGAYASFSPEAEPPQAAAAPPRPAPAPAPIGGSLSNRLGRPSRPGGGGGLGKPGGLGGPTGGGLLGGALGRRLNAAAPNERLASRSEANLLMLEQERAANARRASQAPQGNISLFRPRNAAASQIAPFPEELSQVSIKLLNTTEEDILPRAIRDAEPKLLLHATLEVLVNKGLVSVAEILNALAQRKEQ